MRLLRTRYQDRPEQMSKVRHASSNTDNAVLTFLRSMRFFLAFRASLEVSFFSFFTAAILLPLIVRQVRTASANVSTQRLTLNRTDPLPRPSCRLSVGRIPDPQPSCDRMRQGCRCSWPRFRYRVPRSTKTISRCHKMWQTISLPQRILHTIVANVR